MLARAHVLSETDVDEVDGRLQDLQGSSNVEHDMNVQGNERDH